MSLSNRDTQTDSTERPIQRIPLKDKIGDSKKAKAWRVQNVKYFADLNSDVGVLRSYYERLYKIAGGYLDKESYNYITNPLNTDKSKYTRKPIAELNNFDIISPIIMSLLGDKIDRMIKPTVVAINSDIENIREEARLELINSELDKVFANTIDQLVGDGQDQQPVQNSEEIEEKIKNIKDEKAIQGAKALEYIMVNNEILRKFRKSFFDWLVTYSCYSIKNVLNKDLEYSSVSPMNVDYVISETQDFVEDAESANVTFYMTDSELIDNYHDDFEEADLKAIENRISGIEAKKSRRYTETDLFYDRMIADGTIDSLGGNFSGSTVHNTVIYVNFRSMIKIGKLTITDSFGEETIIEVDEDFIPMEGEDVKWMWVNQVWEGTSINDEIFINIQPVPFQRGKIDNPSAGKLLINGRSFMSSTFKHKSPLEKLIPYQKRYNVISYHLEKLINKNKDKLVKFPKSLIPDDDDMNVFDMLYHADNDSFLFVDGHEKDKNMAGSLAQIQVIDLSLSQNISFLSELLKATKAEAESIIGFNRQRVGNVNSSDGKGVNEDALQRSNSMTSEIFEQYEEYEEREWQGLLDLSKVAWVGGKKEQFIGGDKRTALLEIDEGYSEIEMGVVATRSSRELKKLDKLRDQAHQQAMLQNGAVMSTLAKMENIDSLPELEDILEESEAKFLKQNQEAAEKENAANIEREQIISEREAEKTKLEYYKVDANNENDIQVALINAQSSENASSSTVSPSVSTGSDSGDSPSSRRNEVSKNNLERRKLAQKDKELLIKEREQVVKLKNPVVGEKK